MATKARQQYFADEDSLQKIRREFSIADDIQQKIDSIEPGAQVNTIETIKVNGAEVEPDENKAIDLTIPGVVDGLDSISSTDALSAKQGKVLYDYIQDVSHIGHFLALWDASTGLPVTNPEVSPYVYNTGDFYTVSNVAPSGGTNYRPDGTQYVIGQASTTVDTDSVAVNDFYFYDGTTWRHMKNSGAGSIAIDGSLSTTSTNPVENRVITNAINGKQNTLIAGSNIQIAADGKTISATDTTYSAGANISIDANNEISATDTKYTAGTNVQISNQNVISATDTKYTAGTGISIDANNVISNTVIPGQTYTAGNGINIDQNNEISIDTSVVATQTDLDGKVSKGVNTANGDLFSIESGNYSTSFGPDFIRSEFSSGANSTYSGLQPGSLGSGNNNKESELSPDSLSLTDSTNMTQTTYAEDEITVVDNGYGTSEAFEFTGGGNNQIARLKDVKIYTAGTGISIDANDEISNTLPGPTIAATAPTGTEGALWYDTTNDVLMAYNGTAWKEAGTQMKILSYGHSTWQDFLNAYNENAVVYCRASSGTDPSTGSQGRLAFMAYVNNANNPTEVEFQYYRSRSDHNSAAYQVDEVYVYKLTSNGTWTVTQRNTAAKAVAGTGISLGWGSGNMTISADTSVLATKTDLNSKQDTLVSGTNIKTVNSNSLLGSGNITLNDVKVSSTAPSSPTEGMVWYDTTNDQLKVYDGSNWNVTGKEYHAGEGIEIGNVSDYSAMQGPAPDGFHVPSKDEWVALCGILTSTFSMDANATTVGTYLKMPRAGYRYSSSSNVGSAGSNGYYLSSTVYTNDRAYYLFFNSSSFNCNSGGYRADGYPVRCFKDTPVIPDSSWTTLYQGSGNAGVFRNSSLGLISVSGDGTTWYTIQDKNLGATTVYNEGDTLSDANCGYFYQWGNNYGFAHSGTVTTSATKVDASSYGPGNYYNSSTFITVSASPYDWSSVQNDNLWGGVTGVVTLDNAITNTGVTSVNGQTGDVTIENESNVRVFTVVPWIINGTTVSQSQQDFNTLMEMGRWIAEGFSYPNNETNRVAILRGSVGVGFSGMEFASIVNVKETPYYTDDSTWHCGALSITYSGNRGGNTSYAVDFSITSSSTSIVFNSTPYGYFTPGTGTTGQVLTKTSSGYNWQDVSGGDVIVSSQPNNILTSGMKIWAGTESDYSNLGTYDTNTVYLTIPDGSVQAIDNNENLPDDSD